MNLRDTLNNHTKKQIKKEEIRVIEHEVEQLNNKLKEEKSKLDTVLIEIEKIDAAIANTKRFIEQYESKKKEAEEFLRGKKEYFDSMHTRDATGSISNLFTPGLREELGIGSYYNRYKSMFDAGKTIPNKDWNEAAMIYIEVYEQLNSINTRITQELAKIEELEKKKKPYLLKKKPIILQIQTITQDMSFKIEVISEQKRIAPSKPPKPPKPPKSVTPFEAAGYGASGASGASRVAAAAYGASGASGASGAYGASGASGASRESRYGDRAAESSKRIITLSNGTEISPIYEDNRMGNRASSTAWPTDPIPADPKLIRKQLIRQSDIKKLSNGELSLNEYRSKYGSSEDLIPELFHQEEAAINRASRQEKEHHKNLESVRDQSDARARARVRSAAAKFSHQVTGLNAESAALLDDILEEKDEESPPSAQFQPPPLAPPPEPALASRALAPALAPESALAPALAQRGSVTPALAPALKKSALRGPYAGSFFGHTQHLAEPAELVEPAELTASVSLKPSHAESRLLTRYNLAQSRYPFLTNQQKIDALKVRHDARRSSSEKESLKKQAALLGANTTQWGGSNTSNYTSLSKSELLASITFNKEFLMIEPKNKKYIDDLNDKMKQLEELDAFINTNQSGQSEQIQSIQSRKRSKRYKKKSRRQNKKYKSNRTIGGAAVLGALSAALQTAWGKITTIISETARLGINTVDGAISMTTVFGSSGIDKTTKLYAMIYDKLDEFLIVATSHMLHYCIINPTVYERNKDALNWSSIINFEGGGIVDFISRYNTEPFVHKLGNCLVTNSSRTKVALEKWTNKISNILSKTDVSLFNEYLKNHTGDFITWLANFNEAEMTIHEENLDDIINSNRDLIEGFPYFLINRTQYKLSVAIYEFLQFLYSERNKYVDKTLFIMNLFGIDEQIKAFFNKEINLFMNITKNDMIYLIYIHCWVLYENIKTFIELIHTHTNLYSKLVEDENMKRYINFICKKYKKRYPKNIEKLKINDTGRDIIDYTLHSNTQIYLLLRTIFGLRILKHTGIIENDYFYKYLYLYAESLKNKSFYKEKSKTAIINTEKDLYMKIGKRYADEVLVYQNINSLQLFIEMKSKRHHYGLIVSSMDMLFKHNSIEVNHYGIISELIKYLQPYKTTEENKALKELDGLKEPTGLFAKTMNTIRLSETTQHYTFNPIAYTKLNLELTSPATRHKTYLFFNKKILMDELNQKAHDFQKIILKELGKLHKLFELDNSTGKHDGLSAGNAALVHGLTTIGTAATASAVGTGGTGAIVGVAATSAAGALSSVFLTSVAAKRANHQAMLAGMTDISTLNMQNILEFRKLQSGVDLQIQQAELAAREHGALSEQQTELYNKYIKAVTSTNYIDEQGNLASYSPGLGHTISTYKDKRKREKEEINARLEEASQLANISKNVTTSSLELYQRKMKNLGDYDKAMGDAKVKNFTNNEDYKRRLNEAAAAAGNTMAVENARGQMSLREKELTQTHAEKMQSAEHNFQLRMQDKKKEFMMDQMKLTMEQARVEQELREREFVNIKSPEKILENKLKESEYNLAREWDEKDMDKTQALANITKNQDEQRDRDKKKWQASFKTSEERKEYYKFVSHDITETFRVFQVFLSELCGQNPVLKQMPNSPTELSVYVVPELSLNNYINTSVMTHLRNSIRYDAKDAASNSVTQELIQCGFESLKNPSIHYDPINGILLQKLFYEQVYLLQNEVSKQNINLYQQLISGKYGAEANNALTAKSTSEARSIVAGSLVLGVLAGALCIALAPAGAALAVVAGAVAVGQKVTGAVADYGKEEAKVSDDAFKKDQTAKIEFLFQETRHWLLNYYIGPVMRLKSHEGKNQYEEDLFYKELVERKSLVVPQYTDTNALLDQSAKTAKNLGEAVGDGVNLLANAYNAKLNPPSEGSDEGSNEGSGKGPGKRPGKRPAKGPAQAGDEDDEDDEDADAETPNNEPGLITVPTEETGNPPNKTIKESKLIPAGSKGGSDRARARASVDDGGEAEGGEAEDGGGATLLQQSPVFTIEKKQYVVSTIERKPKDGEIVDGDKTKWVWSDSQSAWGALTNMGDNKYQYTDLENNVKTIILEKATEYLEQNEGMIEMKKLYDKVPKEYKQYIEACAQSKASQMANYLAQKLQISGWVNSAINAIKRGKTAITDANNKYTEVSQKTKDALKTGEKALEFMESFDVDTSLVRGLFSNASKLVKTGNNLQARAQTLGTKGLGLFGGSIKKKIKFKNKTFRSKIKLLDQK